MLVHAEDEPGLLGEVGLEAVQFGVLLDEFQELVHLQPAQRVGNQADGLQVLTRDLQHLAEPLRGDGLEVLGSLQIRKRLNDLAEVQFHSQAILPMTQSNGSRCVITVLVMYSENNT